MNTPSTPSSRAGKKRPSPPLTLAYQPIISLADGEMTAIEALTRVRLPVFGDVSSARFVSWGETVRLSRLHTSWVLRRACAEASGWQQARRPLRLSVNVSARDLADRRFAAAVTTALTESALYPSNLQLEITETSLISGDARVREALDGLRGMGVRIAIDDFGVGFSTLKTMLDVAADVVKLDRCFIERVTESSKGRAIVESAIRLAHDLGMEVVGEGVETTEQRDFLRTAGCDAIQGFLVSPAMSYRLLSGMVAIRARRIGPQLAPAAEPAMALAAG